MYKKRDISNFVGIYLRLFTQSSRLLPSFLHMNFFSDLSSLIIDLDFSVASDALETFESIFTAERKPPTKGPNEALKKFVTKHSQEIM